MVTQMNDNFEIFSEDHCLNIDVLNSYNKGKLDSEDIVKVEKHLIDCPLCSCALEGLKNINDLNLAKRDISEIKEKILRQLERNSNRKTKVIRYLAIAATLLGLISSYWIINFNGSKTDIIFEDYFSLYPNLTPIVRNQVIESNFIKAMQNYEKRNFNSSEALLLNIPETNHNYLASRFYLGIISLNNKKLKEADIHFSYVISQADSIYRQPAVWYLALTYLKRKQISNSLIYFKELAESHSEYRLKCIQILERINQIEVSY